MVPPPPQGCLLCVAVGAPLVGVDSQVLLDNLDTVDGMLCIYNDTFCIFSSYIKKQLDIV